MALDVFFFVHCCECSKVAVKQIQLNFFFFWIIDTAELNN